MITDSSTDNILTDILVNPDQYSDQDMQKIAAYIDSNIEFAIEILASDVRNKLDLTPNNRASLIDAAINKILKTTPDKVHIHDLLHNAEIITYFSDYTVKQRIALKKYLREGISEYRVYILRHLRPNVAKSLLHDSFSGFRERTKLSSYELRQIAFPCEDINNIVNFIESGSSLKYSKKPSPSPPKGRKKRSPPQRKLSSSTDTDSFYEASDSSSSDTWHDTSIYQEYGIDCTSWPESVALYSKSKISMMKSVKFLSEYRFETRLASGNHVMTYPLIGLQGRFREIINQMHTIIGKTISPYLNEHEVVLITGGTVLNILAGINNLDDIDVLILSPESISHLTNRIKNAELSKFKYIELINLEHQGSAIQIVTQLLNGKANLLHAIVTEMQRRDVGINCLYYFPKMDVLIDPNDALETLNKKRRLAFLKNPAFTDNLKLHLRAIRTFAKLQFYCNQDVTFPELQNNMPKTLRNITTLRYQSPQSFCGEIIKGLSSDYCYEYMRLLIHYQILHCLSFDTLFDGDIFDLMLEFDKHLHRLCNDETANKIVNLFLTTTPKAFIILALLIFPIYRVFRDDRAQRIAIAERKYFEYQQCFVDTGLSFFKQSQAPDSENQQMVKSLKNIEQVSDVFSLNASSMH